RDSADDRLIGYFYTDFFPRPLKYGHAAAFPLISGRVLENGKYSLPISAIVANMTPPSGDKPSMLTHLEVETVFHEFGHIMHQTLTRAPYTSLSGSSVAQDFVEAPSQMLENWVWQPQVLALLSGHYLDHSQKLPQDLLNRMIQARDYQRGYYYARQVMLALTDMTYHVSDSAVDTAATYNQLYKEIIGVEPIQGGHFAAGFSHLMGGYDAGYYGYLWSQVYAEDMFTMFAADPLNPLVGASYRKNILEPGNMKEAVELFRAFVGRDLDQTPFFKMLGI
ncbi:MAG: M3 family metallopeptidase, partial [Bdellovibrionota bacterium]